jgi:hypothetical protein
MAMNRIQFQQGLSLPQFMVLYGSEEKCEASLEQARWPDGFRCPRCDLSSLGSSMAGATSAISAGAATIRPPSPLERSWRQQSCL